MTSWSRGHRLSSHTADVLLDARGPDRVSCIEEALCALIDVFADTRRARVSRRLPFRAEGATEPDLLVSALEEAIYLIDALSIVPLRFRLVAAESDPEAITGQVEVAESDDVELTGPVPKGVSYHGLEMCNEEGTWRCRAVLDV